MVKHHGHFVWYELMTTDMAAAKAFYADVVELSPKDREEIRSLPFDEDQVAGMLTWPASRGIRPLRARGNRRHLSECPQP